jgi:hypothetical protein
MVTRLKRTKPISDFAAIGDELDFIKAQLARIPTRKELAQKRCSRRSPGLRLSVRGSRSCSDDDGRPRSPHIVGIVTLDLTDEQKLALAAGGARVSTVG